MKNITYSIVFNKENIMLILKTIIIESFLKYRNEKQKNG